MPSGHILVADDDAAIRTVLNQALSRAGYEVRSTGTVAGLWRWVAAGEGDELLALADRLKGKLADAVIVLGSAGEDRVDLVASVAPSLVGRGLRAGQIVKLAAGAVGGGGGGRDTFARAGGRDVDKLPAAIEAARAAIEAALAEQ